MLRDKLQTHSRMQYSLRKRPMRVRTTVIAVLLFLVCGAFGQVQTENPAVAIRTALGNRDFDKAVELTRSALRGSPNNAQLWTFQGIALSGKGDNSSAFIAFQHALKIDPNNLGALAGAAQSAYATVGTGRCRCSQFDVGDDYAEDAAFCRAPDIGPAARTRQISRTLKRRLLGS